MLPKTVKYKTVHNKIYRRIFRCLKVDAVPGWFAVTRLNGEIVLIPDVSTIIQVGRDVQHGLAVQLN